jgi:hypothetical protein
MIAQTLAAHRPDRIRSLTSIMGNTGSRLDGQPRSALWPHLLKPPPRTRAAYVEHGLRLFRRIGSPAFGADEQSLRETLALSFDRGAPPDGVARQLGAIFTAGALAAAVADRGLSAQEHLAVIVATYLEVLAAMPLAAGAFLVEIRAAGAPSQQHHRAIQDQFAELLLIPGLDDDPLMRTALLAAIDEIIVREIVDNGTDRLPELAPALTVLATRILSPASASSAG